MAALEGRKRLESTLSSPALSDKENVYRLVSSQLAAAAASSSLSSSSSASSSSSSPSPSLHTHTHNDRNNVHETSVQTQFEHVWSLLELLRSASGEENHNLSISGEDETPNDGWKLKHDTGQLRVMYREGPKGTPYHTLLAEGFVNSPITSALCLAWEVPSYHLWWPQMTVPMFKIIDSKWIKRGFNGEDLSLIRVKVPWPLAAREVLMCSFELEFFEEDLILVLLHSLPDTEESHHGLKSSDVPDASSNVVRIELAGGLALQRLSSERSYFRTVANFDMKLDFIPPWIINFISRQLIGLGFKLYEKTLLSVNKEGSSGHFQKLIQTEPMYARIREWLEVKKAESDGKEMVSRKDAAQKRPSTGDVSRATKSSNLEDEGPVSGILLSNLNEITQVSREEGTYLESAPSNSVAKQNYGAGVGVDAEVQKALDVLDKMISLVQSRKVGSTNNSILLPYNNDDAGSSHGPSKQSVQTQCNDMANTGNSGSLHGPSKHSVQTQCGDMANNGKEVELKKVAPLEQVLQRTQQLTVTKRTSRFAIKRKWFCFSFSPVRS